MCQSAIVFFNSEPRITTPFREPSHTFVGTIWVYSSKTTTFLRFRVLTESTYAFLRPVTWSGGDPLVRDYWPFPQLHLLRFRLATYTFQRVERCYVYLHPVPRFYCTLLLACFRNPLTCWLLLVCLRSSPLSFTYCLTATFNECRFIIRGLCS